MKIIQLSDFHLRNDDLLSSGVINTTQQVKKTLDYFNKMPENDLPELFIVSGDLADDASYEVYHKIKKLLNKLPRPVYTLPGNRDNRTAMTEILGDMCPAEKSVSPYICYSIDDMPIRIIVIDTVNEGKHGGYLDDRVGDWLEKKLAEQPNKHTLVFTHHPPFITNMGAMDEKFHNKKRLGEILSKHKKVRLCCGHMHRPIMTNWKGVQAMICPPVSMLINLDLSPEGGHDFYLADPFYAIHDLAEDGINTHFSIIPTGASYDGPYSF